MYMYMYLEYSYLSMGQGLLIGASFDWSLRRHI